MEYTGLPDIAGEIQFRFYRCYEHGVFKVYEKRSEGNTNQFEFLAVNNCKQFMKKHT